MRFKEIFEMCMDVNKVLDEYREEITEYYRGIKRIKEGAIATGEERHNTERFYRAFDNLYLRLPRELEMINYFNPTIFKMRETLSYNNKTKPDNLMALYRELDEKIKCVILLYQTVKDQNENGIGLKIKLPDLNDITELKKYIDGLEFVFTKCPFFQNDDASLKLETVESGSIWLIFGVTCTSVALGSVLLNNIAAFIDKCFVIKSHRLTCKRQEQEIESAKIDQKEKEELLKNIRRLYKISVENAIRDLQIITECSIQDGDEMGRVEQSFDKMIKMLEQGLQIYASLNSPQEVKALFAPLEMHYLSMAKKVEKIEEKAETDTE